MHVTGELSVDPSGLHYILFLNGHDHSVLFLSGVSVPHVHTNKTVFGVVRRQQYGQCETVQICDRHRKFAPHRRRASWHVQGERDYSGSLFGCRLEGLANTKQTHKDPNNTPVHDQIVAMAEEKVMKILAHPFQTSLKFKDEKLFSYVTKICPSGCVMEDCIGEQCTRPPIVNLYPTCPPEPDPPQWSRPKPPLRSQIPLQWIDPRPNQEDQTTHL